jgi:hypothetical protein
VLSYCGAPFKTWQDGEWRTVHGWQDLRMQHYPALGRRLSGACDVPDLALFPQYVPGVRNVSFHAALEAPWEQLALWAMAWLTRAGLVGDWVRFGPTFSSMSDKLIRLGSQRLLAEQNHGPEIPCTPAIVISKKLLRGDFAQPGAYACLGLFTTAEFMAELADFEVTSETR